MLTAADRDLARRDPALPGIRLALDIEALADRLARWLPADEALVDGRVTYLRYKPRTSLVAGLALRTVSGHRQAFVKAYGPGSAPKLAKLRTVGAHDRIGLGTFIDDTLRLAVVDATSDRRLPALRRMLAETDPCVEPLRYKPERRWVGVAGRLSSEPRLVKIHQPGFARSFARRHAALEHAGLPVPALRKAQPATGLMTYEWFEGEHLEDVEGGAAPALLTEVGALLGRLHAAPATAGPTAVPVNRAAELADAVRAIAAAVPGAARAAGETARSARAGLADSSAPHTMVHGDFSTDQVLVRPDGLRLLDLDRATVDDPAVDIASWFADEVVAGRVPVDAEPRDVLAPMLDGYPTDVGAPMLRHLDQHAAVALLKRAVEPFRTHAHDWPSRVDTYVRAAHRLAERTPVT